MHGDALFRSANPCHTNLIKLQESERNMFKLQISFPQISHLLYRFYLRITIPIHRGFNHPAGPGSYLRRVDSLLLLWMFRFLKALGF